MRELEAAGINMNDVTKQLELEGVKAFFDSYNSLIETTESKVAKLQAESEAAPSTAGRVEVTEIFEILDAPADAASSGTGAAAAPEPSVEPSSQSRVANDYPVRASLGPLQTAVDTALAWAAEEQVAPRVWEKDPNLWKPKPADQSEITDRLGWLTVTRRDDGSAAASQRSARRRPRYRYHPRGGSRNGRQQSGS